jgi:hypothetical protein
MNQVHRAFCAKAPRDRGCVKNASNKKNFKTKYTCSIFKTATKAKIFSRCPAPGSDFAVSEQTLERFTATVCVYLVWHYVEEYAVNISDSSSWLQVRAADKQHCRICAAAGMSIWLLLHQAHRIHFT